MAISRDDGANGHLELGVHSMSINSFGARRTLDVDGQSYEIYDIDAVPGSSDLPYLSLIHISEPTRPY